MKNFIKKAIYSSVLFFFISSFTSCICNCKNNECKIGKNANKVTRNIKITQSIESKIAYYALEYMSMNTDEQIKLKKKFGIGTEKVNVPPAKKINFFETLNLTKECCTSESACPSGTTAEQRNIFCDLLNTIIDIDEACGNGGADCREMWYNFKGDIDIEFSDITFEGDLNNQVLTFDNTYGVDITTIDVIGNAGEKIGTFVETEKGKHSFVSFGTANEMNGKIQINFSPSWNKKLPAIEGNFNVK